MQKIKENETLDQEWITLIEEAKKLGIPLEEVSQFLNSVNQKSEA